MTTHTALKSTVAAAALLVIAHTATAQITFYEGEGFRGRAFTTDKATVDFTRNGFNDKASSVIVDRGRWEVCDDTRFEGRCVLLRRGSYDSLRGLGLDNRVSSVRPAANNRRYDNEAPEPLASPNYEYRRRANEQVFQAPVTSVRAVVGPPNQRCWMERQQVQAPAQQNQPNLGAAVIGGLLGGVLGHQVGGGSGKDLATAGGAVAGAVAGSRYGNNSSSGVAYNDVQRCENTASTTPAYYDVTYNHRGIDHRVQMTAPPVGNTVAVNRNGEPRQ